MDLPEWRIYFSKFTFGGLYDLCHLHLDKEAYIGLAPDGLCFLCKMGPPKEILIQYDLLSNGYIPHTIKYDLEGNPHSLVL